MIKKKYIFWTRFFVNDEFGKAADKNLKWWAQCIDSYQIQQLLIGTQEIVGKMIGLHQRIYPFLIACYGTNQVSDTPQSSIHGLFKKYFHFLIFFEQGILLLKTSHRER